MKKIIEGYLFDTKKAKRVWTSLFLFPIFWSSLYQTPKKRFYIVSSFLFVFRKVEPISINQVKHWLATSSLKKYQEVFPNELEEA